jgi:hypothetical protein
MACLPCAGSALHSVGPALGRTCTRSDLWWVRPVLGQPALVLRAWPAVVLPAWLAPAGRR